MENAFDTFVRYLRQEVKSFNSDIANSKKNLRAFAETDTFKAGAKKIWDNKGITGIENDLDVQMMSSAFSEMWSLGILLYAIQQMEE